MRNHHLRSLLNDLIIFKCLVYPFLSKHGAKEWIAIFFLSCNNHLCQRTNLLAKIFNSYLSYRASSHTTFWHTIHRSRETRINLIFPHRPKKSYPVLKNTAVICHILKRAIRPIVKLVRISRGLNTISRYCDENTLW